MDRMAFDCEIKLAGDGADTSVGTVEGYGSMFGILDRGGDIMEPGAFKSTLGDWRKRKQLPAMLWQHQHDNPVGVWTDIVEDEKGLKVSGNLVMDVPQAAVARALIKAGAVKGLSIGYQTRDALVDRQTGARRLKKVDLWEISLVTIPMLPEAQISGVKGAFDPNSLERALRDEGGCQRRPQNGLPRRRTEHAPRRGGRCPDVPAQGRRGAALKPWRPPCTTTASRPCWPARWPST
jgi:HK97 family phage prohead protease